MSGQGQLYVGYLPMPPRVRTFVRVVAPVILWGLFAISAVCAWHLRDVGDAVWESATSTWTGTVVIEPYPMLITTDDSGETVAMPVVSDIKFGEHERLGPHDGTVVELTGWRLARERREMISLVPDDTAIRPLGGVPSMPERSVVGEVAIVGELVDGKCYLGAMKPGDGKAHKACAIQCIESGLPMMLAPVDTSQPLVLVTGWRDQPIWEAQIRDLVAQPVVVRGAMSEIAGLGILEIASVEPAR
ncbi:MAG: hypothetical protein AAGI30_10840 [Planctomycetota bacterium]